MDRLETNGSMSQEAGPDLSAPAFSAGASPRLFHVPCATEPQPVHLRLGISSVPLSRPHRRRTVNLPATTKGFLRPAFRPLGIPVYRRLVIVRVVPVSCPFRHIASHLIDAVRANRILVLVHGNDRRIEQEPLWAVADRSGQSGAAEVGSARSAGRLPRDSAHPPRVPPSPIRLTSVSACRPTCNRPPRHSMTHASPDGWPLFPENCLLILPVDEGRQIFGEDGLQMLHGGHFELVDLVCIQVDLPLWEFRLIGILSTFLSLPMMNEPAGTRTISS